MTIIITAIQMSPPAATDHEHIAWLRWNEHGSTVSVMSTREAVIEWIDGGGDAWVQDAQGAVQVGVVRANPPYLRTFADGRPTDNLLDLPRF